MTFKGSGPGAQGSSRLSLKPCAFCSMSNRIVRNGRLNLGVRSRRRDRGQRAGERYLQYLVHRVDHVDVECVEYVLGDIGEVFLVVARQQDRIQPGAMCAKHLLLYAANRQKFAAKG